MRASAGNRGLRMTYVDGVLWIMSPEFRHEAGARRLGAIVDAYTCHTGLDCEATGATTFRNGVPGRAIGQGKEGDETYYLGAVAARIRDKTSINLAVDPPPSLWIEVDNYGETRGKPPLYAALGIAEVWQYRAPTHTQTLEARRWPLSRNYREPLASRPDDRSGSILAGKRGEARSFAMDSMDSERLVSRKPRDLPRLHESTTLI